jgi:hypothetical protein
MTWRKRLSAAAQITALVVWILSELAKLGAI